MASAASTASGLKGAGAVVGDVAGVWAATSNRLVAKKNAITKHNPAMTLLCLARAAASIREVNNRDPVQKKDEVVKRTGVSAVVSRRTLNITMGLTPSSS
jgi:hypothetical protein